MAASRVLPSSQHRFHISVTGEETGIPFEGDFVFHRPSIGERSQIDVTRARLCGDMSNLDPLVADQNYMLAFLRVTISEFPSWWRDADMGMGLFDLNVVMAVYDQCLNFEKEWREKVYGSNDPGKPKFVRNRQGNQGSDQEEAPRDRED